MKKLILYTVITVFYSAILAAIFSFTSHKKNDSAVQTVSAASVSALPVVANKPVLDSSLSIEDDGNVMEDYYRPTHEMAARAIYGTASYYHNKFNGRQTANGEIFSQKKLTGASNFLPLNEWVKVTNLRNNKSVIVKITDRMHPKMTRVIDLSKAAAQQLAYVGNGLAQVKVVRLGKSKPAA